MLESSCAIGLVLVLLASQLSCVTSDVARVTTKTYPPRPAGCSVEVFTASAPSYPVEDIATDRVDCHSSRTRTACLDQLKNDACKNGGDTLYGFREGTAPGGYNVLSATIALRTGDPVAPKAASSTQPSGDGCEPICSPGFKCIGGTCEPQCNPACDPGERCGKDRLCHPATPGPN